MDECDRPQDVKNNRISIIALADRSVEVNKNGTGEDTRQKMPADFETAIAAAGCRKFQYLLLLAIIPVSWSTSIDTSNVAIILPSVECDLQITFFQKGVLNAVTFLGMVSSGYLWGYVADVRGRKNVFIYGCLADGICNVLSGFSQNFWTLAFFKYLSGFIISGPHASIVAYCSEFYGVKDRVRIPLIFGLSVAFGNIVTAALAWIVVPQTWSIVLWDGAFVYNSWRLFLSLCGAPMLFGVACLSFFPESPKFLMSQGRTREALQVFKLIYRLNTGRSAEEYPIQHLEDESYQKSTHNSGQGGKSQKTAIFFHPHLPRLLLVTVMQFGSMLAMNTIRLWQPQLFTILDNYNSLNYNATAGQDLSFCEILDTSTVANGASAVVENSTCVNSVVNGTVYLNTIIVSIFGCTCLLMASLILNILNHRNLLFICYTVTFFCIIYMNWSTNMLLTLLLTCLFVGMTNMAVNVVIGTTIVLFPTSLRAIAVSLVMSSGRTGSIMGNLLFPVLLQYGCLAPVIELAAFVGSCILFTYILPLSKETKKQGAGKVFGRSRKNCYVS